MRRPQAIIAGRARHAGAASGRILDGDFDLAELRELVARAAVYIGGDSGPLHVAATTETPIVAAAGTDAAGTFAAVARPALVYRNG